MIFTFRFKWLIILWMPSLWFLFFSFYVSLSPTMNRYYMCNMKYLFKNINCKRSGWERSCLIVGHMKDGRKYKVTEFMNHRQYEKLQPDLPALHMLQCGGLRSTQFNSTKKTFSGSLMNCDVSRGEQKNLEFSVAVRKSWINRGSLTETIYD